ncbi:PadR family transcriptional regulator [Micromonospora lupini]|uniref:PadR family transcriptional regulator n=1 Tax=Micromonospora lupini TaxID=285679 RepID=UPI002257F1D3|nr:helix-turn-helix transcriptional regulator [Micromonospora lupini]MCX5070131.1 PadR family transcriptional regulator [Micromonospora lupini]
MPTNALVNPLVLPILGLLVEQPRHPYGVFSELRHRYEYLRVRSATIYTLLNTLSRAGWVEAAEQQDPPVLSTTEAGREALAERVTTGLRSSALSGDTTFMTALAYIGILGPNEAIDMLQARLDRIRTEQERVGDILDQSDALHLHMIEAHYYLDRLRNDAAWIENTIGQIEDETLAWPRQGRDDSH